MIEGAIFDLDGTLLDSMFIWNTLGEDYLRSLGYQPKGNVNEDFKTLSLYEGACYYKREYGIPFSVEELMNGVNKTVENYYFNTVMPKNGVVELLSELSLKGIKLVVATATDRYQVEAALKRCKLDKYFERIFTCSEVGHGKSEPNIFEEALNFLGTSKKKTLVFEDGFHAVKTAKRAGFITVGIEDSNTEEKEEIKLISDFYIDDYDKKETINNFWKFASEL